MVVPSDDYVYSYIEGVNDLLNSSLYRVITRVVKQDESFDTTDLVSNIKTTNIKQFKNGEVCLKASKYLLIDYYSFNQFYRAVYNKELKHGYFQP